MINEKSDFISEEQLKKYAELAVQVGVNVQPNQLVIIHSDIEHVTLARLVQKAAYEAGASNVVIDWTDEQSTQAFYLHAKDEAIDYFPEWQVARFKEWNELGAAYIRIISENPDVSKDVSKDRISRFQKLSRAKLNFYYAKTRSYEVRWCLLVTPSSSWAAKLFPNLSNEQALQTLWEFILQGARADGINPIKNWEVHGKVFESRKKFLNKNQFESLHFANSRGTDLLVGMPKNHCYLGGEVRDKKGIPFYPNIPPLKKSLLLLINLR